MPGLVVVLLQGHIAQSGTEIRPASCTIAIQLPFLVVLLRSSHMLDTLATSLQANWLSDTATSTR